MTFNEFRDLVAQNPDGVVLLEGRRSIPEGDAGRAKELASHLARRFPRLRFRSGNATGADQAFSSGVVEVDASRLQIVAPYATHRQSARYPEAVYDSPESLSQAQEETVAYRTASASPVNRALIENRNAQARLAAKASYLIRDTMKVLGHSVDFPKPICALFYIDPEDPMDGGTGHTIRVCHQEGVPVVFQDSWADWSKTIGRSD
jgi:hypothetical protein